MFRQLRNVHFTISMGLGLGLVAMGLGLGLGLEALSLESKSDEMLRVDRYRDMDELINF